MGTFSSRMWTQRNRSVCLHRLFCRLVVVGVIIIVIIVWLGLRLKQSWFFSHCLTHFYWTDVDVCWWKDSLWFDPFLLDKHIWLKLFIAFTWLLVFFVNFQKFRLSLYFPWISCFLQLQIFSQYKLFKSLYRRLLLTMMITIIFILISTQCLIIIFSLFFSFIYRLSRLRWLLPLINQRSFSLSKVRYMSNSGIILYIYISRHLMSILKTYNLWQIFIWVFPRVIAHTQFHIQFQFALFI